MTPPSKLFLNAVYLSYYGPMHTACTISVWGKALVNGHLAYWLLELPDLQALCTSVLVSACSVKVSSFELPQDITFTQSQRKNKIVTYMLTQTWLIHPAVHDGHMTPPPPSPIVTGCRKWTLHKVSHPCMELLLISGINKLLPLVKQGQIPV